MKYRVHQFATKGAVDRGELEEFLNKLDGEVVSIIPEIKKNSIFQIYGITLRVDHLLIVEKTS